MQLAVVMPLGRAPPRPSLLTHESHHHPFTTIPRNCVAAPQDFKSCHHQITRTTPEIGVDTTRSRIGISGDRMDISPDRTGVAVQGNPWWHLSGPILKHWGFRLGKAACVVPTRQPRCYPFDLQRPYFPETKK